MKILHNGASFKCSCNPSIWITAKEDGNTKARDSRKKILTSRAQCQVKTPLTCPVLTAQAGGTPTPCQLSQGSWVFTSSKMKCEGYSVLTDMSYTMCMHGGIITFNNVFQNISSIVPVVIIRDMSAGMQSGSNSSSSGQTASSAQNPGGASGAVENPAGGQPENQYVSHAKCEYGDCEDSESCEYLNSQVFVENISKKLSDNFKQNRKAEWDEYYSLHTRKNQESEGGGWRIAAHHIVSGNQVLMMKDEKNNPLYGEIVKLANYFGYDVNNAENCIMLPTNQSNFGDNEPLLKAATAYDVMGFMGRQWHVGGHEYRLDKETLKNMHDFYQKHPEQYPSPGNPDFFSNYKMAMKEEMDKIYIKYSKPRCWKKNYEKNKRNFINELNGLSKKVERYLVDFKENPRKSFPFFVSKVTVEYAYDLPSTTKIIVIYGDHNHIMAKKVRMERYLKNDLKINPVDKGGIEISDNKEFIAFCENIIYFFIDESVGDYALPFGDIPGMGPIKKDIHLAGDDAMTYLSNHSNEVMAFVNKEQYPYQPIAKVVSERGGTI